MAPFLSKTVGGACFMLVCFHTSVPLAEERTINAGPGQVWKLPSAAEEFPLKVKSGDILIFQQKEVAPQNRHGLQILKEGNQGFEPDHSRVIKCNETESQKPDAFFQEIPAKCETVSMYDKDWPGGSGESVKLKVLKAFTDSKKNLDFWCRVHRDNMMGSLKPEN